MFLSITRRLRQVNPVILDGGLALGLATVVLVEVASLSDCDCSSTSQTAWTVFFMLMMTVPLALRRRYPFTVLNLIGIAGVSFELLNFPLDPYTRAFATIVGLYSVAAHARRDLAFAGAAITFAVLFAVNLPKLGHDPFRDVIDDFVYLGGAWIVGDYVRSLRRERALMRERAERAERERAEEVGRAQLAERARIAREVHDVVAHSVSVIGIQAGAARRIVAEQPERARQVLLSIEQITKETMAELRGALGVLRSPTEEAELAPQPGLRDLGDLLGQLRRAGLTVGVDTEGEPRDLSPGIDWPPIVWCRRP
jgi:signal transduction histidine kinase